MSALFADRTEAGRQLAKKLTAWAERNDVIVLALPRGGLPVAYEIAKFLNATMDLMLVRKLGVPGNEELALGALALPDIVVYNRDVIRSLSLQQGDIDLIIAKETLELRRRNRLYRNDEPPPDLKQKIVILADDGVATGANMRAAIMAALQQDPQQVIAAFPVGSPDTVEMLKNVANDVVCAQIVQPLFGVSQAYENFPQLEDADVLHYLDIARQFGKNH